MRIMVLSVNEHMQAYLFIIIIKTYISLKITILNYLLKKVNNNKKIELYNLKNV